MSEPTQVSDGAGKARRLTNAETLIWGLARAHNEPVYWCSTHPIFAGQGGRCPRCGALGNRFVVEKGVAA